MIDARHHSALHTIELGDAAARPMGLAVSPDGGRLYVANGRARSVSVIDLDRGLVVQTIADVAVRPWGLGLTPDGRTLYAAGGPSDDVAVIDTASGKVRARIPAGRSPWGVAVAATVKP